MRVFRYVFLALLLATAFSWLIRGGIYRAVVHYRIVGERAEVERISSSTKGAMDLELAIDAALDTTAARLHFSTGQVSNDPGELVHGGAANCIGYAALCASLLEGELERAGLADRYSVKVVIGKLYIGTLDLHSFSSSPFWKDHDVVRVVDEADGGVILLDPTLYDAVGIGKVRSADEHTLLTPK